MDQNRISEILEFWFQGLTDKDKIYQGHPVARRWFNQNDDFDREIRERFGADVEAASEGKYQDWSRGAAGRLALIILTDQFPRNIYRQTPQMYATDPLALSLARQSLSDGFDRQLSLIERTFVYIPFMHSEDATTQKLSVKCYEDLTEESKSVCPQSTGYYEYTLKYARQHHDDIARDGRFVYRDKILKRD